MISLEPWGFKMQKSFTRWFIAYILLLVIAVFLLFGGKWYLPVESQSEPNIGNWSYIQKRDLVRMTDGRLRMVWAIGSDGVDLTGLTEDQGTRFEYDFPFHKYPGLKEGCSLIPREVNNHLVPNPNPVWVDAMVEFVQQELGDPMKRIPEAEEEE